MSTSVSKAFAAAGLLLLTACDGCNKPPVAVDAGIAAPVTPAPSDGVELIRKADEALQAGKLDEAIELAQKAIEKEPRHAVASNILGRAAAKRFEQTKDPKDAVMAENAFGRALELSPDFWPAHQNRGELYERQGMMDKAAADYRAVLASQQNHPDKRKFEAIIAAVDGGAK